MNLLGNGLIFVAIAAALLSAVHYFRSGTAGERVLRGARSWMYLSAGAVAAISALLMFLILEHDFSNGYVFSYSSRALPLHFLLSSFYAGQEGSFLFWALCTALLGLSLARYSRTRSSESWIMAVFMGIQVIMLMLVYAKTPFRAVWEMVPGAPLGEVPVDGRGLNPLLQNFWMVIHPPVLFIGFAAMAVPFALAIASLWRNDYKIFSAQAFGWLLFAVFVLGAGIMLGGYWAYGVLGWGGYWGWDPVENSSLVPWLTGVALVHTMLVHRRTGKLLRTNLALAIVSFLLVVYSTFLTRSGILGDSSVHAFVDPGATVYWLLVFFLALTSGVGFGLLVARRASLRPATTDKRFISRETLLATGTIALLLSAGVILFGTSLPLMSNSTVDAAFYDTMNLPVVVAMVLLIGMSLYMQWGTDTLGGMFKRSAKWIVVSILVTGGIAFAGVRDFDVFVLFFASVFAVLVNLEFGWTQFRTDRGAIGGKLAHIGLGVFLLGVIASGRFNQTQHLSLELGKPVEALGHTLTYTGYKPTPDNKYAFSVEVRQGGSAFTLLPVMFDGGQQGIMRNPDIASFFTSDFYISPVSLEQPHAEESDQAESFTIEKGKSITLGKVKATFVKFDMSARSQDAMAQGSSNGMTVGSIIELSDGKVTETVTPLVVYGAGGEQEHRIAASKLLNANIKLVSMNVGGMGAAASSVTIGIQAGAHTHDQAESLIVEASIKPFIGLVWAGTVVMFAGFFLAMLKRLKEA